MQHAWHLIYICASGLPVSSSTVIPRHEYCHRRSSLTLISLHRHAAHTPNGQSFRHTTCSSRIAKDSSSPADRSVLQNMQVRCRSSRSTSYSLHSRNRFVGLAGPAVIATVLTTRFAFICTLPGRPFSVPPYFIIQMVVVNYYKGKVDLHIAPPCLLKQVCTKHA